MEADRVFRAAAAPEQEVGHFWEAGVSFYFFWVWGMGYGVGNLDQDLDRGG